jgi:hypothetical protein
LEQAMKGIPMKMAKNKKMIGGVVLAVLLMGGSTAFIPLKNPGTDDPGPQRPEITEDALTPEDTAPTELVYAYKEGKKTEVKTLNLAASQKVVLFSFIESDPVPEGKIFYPHLPPSVSINPAGDKFAYVEDDDLLIRNSDGTTEKLIDTTSKKKSSRGSFIVLETNPEIPSSEGSGIMKLAAPEWSKDGATIGLIGRHYEGHTYHLFNLSTNQFINVGKTFEYIDETPLEDSFTIKSLAQPFRDHGVFPAQLLVPNSMVKGPIFSESRDSIYGIFCPLDLPNSGYHRYATVVNNKKRYTEKQLSDRQSLRDCGEPGNRTLIKIDLDSGAYEELAEDRYSFSIAQAPDDGLFIALDEKGDFDVVKVSFDGSDSERLGILDKAGIDKESVKHVLVRDISNPVAEIYFEADGKHHVAVMHLDSGDKIATFWVEEVSQFVVLALR